MNNYLKLSKAKSAPNYCILIIMLLVFIERLFTLRELGLNYTGYGDSMNYYQSALNFIESGTICYVTTYPTAQIMPGIVFLWGLFMKIFGTQIWQSGVAIRVFYYILASFTAYFTYKSVSIFVSKWYGVFASLAYLLPNMAWSSNSIGTEAPYLLLFSMVIYYTFMLGEDLSTKNIIMYVISFMLAFMFRANILIMLIFTPLYLFVFKKLKFQSIHKFLIILISCLLLFIVPWTIRNYIYFHAFIPISYGSGNPMLLGTYNGEGSLPEDDVTTKEVADEIFYREYSDYYNEDGSVKEPQCESFLSLTHDNIEAKVRIKEWLQRDPRSFLKYYLIIKPRLLLNWVWYWDSVFGVSYQSLHILSIINMLICAAGLVISLIVKKNRGIMIYLTSLYIVSIYYCSMAFVSDRYSILFMPIRYVMAGISLYLVIFFFQFLRNKYHKKLSI